METVDETFKAQNPRYNMTAISIDFPVSNLPTTHVRTYITNQSGRAASVIDREFSFDMFSLNLAKGKWDLANGGYLEFPTVEADANLKTQRIEFGPSRLLPNPEFRAASVTGGSIVIDGRNLQIKEIKFLGCER